MCAHLTYKCGLLDLVRERDRASLELTQNVEQEQKQKQLNQMVLQLQRLLQDLRNQIYIKI